MQGFPEQAIIEIHRIFTFYHFHFATGYVFPGERHPFWEMVYVLNGQVDIGADERVYALNAGDLIFHQPDEYHSIFAAMRMRRTWSSFPSTANPRPCAVLSEGACIWTKRSKRK